MKTLNLFFVSLSFFVLFSFCQHPNLAQTSSRTINLNKVDKNDSLNDLFHSGDYFLARQPDLETLKFLKGEGVQTIINLRSEQEINNFSASDFDEKEVTESMGFTYFHIPVNGFDSYNPETLKEFANVLNTTTGKILIHCAGAVRAMYLLMGYLVEYEQKPINDVIGFGKQIKYSMPLEGLLGVKLDVSVNND